MSKTALAVSIWVIALLGAPASHAASPKETLAAFHDALASGDRDKALGFLSPGITIYEAGNVERSRDEYAGHHLGADMNFAKGSTRKVLKQTERIEGNTAVVWDETETTVSTRGNPVRVLGTGTTVLERKDDGWVIVHVHWSSRKAK